MAGREHQAEQVVPDVVLVCDSEVRLPRLPRLDLASELLLLALEHLVAAQAVDAATLGGGHEPGARIVRDARLRPLLERGHEGLLREVLGPPDVAHHSRETGDEAGRLDAPDGVDGAMDVGRVTRSRRGRRLRPTRAAGS